MCLFSGDTWNLAWVMGVGFSFAISEGFLSDLVSLNWEIKMLKCGDLGGESSVDEPGE